MRSINDVRIATKLSLAFGCLAAVTVGISAVGYGRLSAIDHTIGLTAHSNEVVESLDAVMLSMVNQETGLRGYLLSGEPGFLSPYKDGKASYAVAMERVRSLTADNGAQQARLADADRAAARWESDVAAKEIALVQAGDLETARRIEASGAGKAAMDALRTAIAEADKAERGLYAGRSADQARSFATAYMASVVGSMVSVAIAAILAFLVFALLTRPMTRLVAVLQRMAQGEIDAEIAEARRGDEIGAVGRAVEGIKALVARKAVEDAELKRIAEVAADRRAAPDDDRAGRQFRPGGRRDRRDGFRVGHRTAGYRPGHVGHRLRDVEPVATVAAAAEEAASNVNTVAAAAEELGSSVQEIGRQVDGSAKLAQGAVSEADRTGALVQALNPVRRRRSATSSG